MAGIDTKGSFLTTAPGLDPEAFTEAYSKNGTEANIKAKPQFKKEPDEHYTYFDDELYKRSTKIEHLNAWMDTFKALLIRFETKINNCRT